MQNVLWTWKITIPMGELNPSLLHDRRLINHYANKDLVTVSCINAVQYI